MNENKLLETLCQQAEDYAKTSIKLFKYNAISKSSDILSSFTLFIGILMATLFSILFASIALAYWIGSCMGKLYYGFMIVALAFIAVSFILYIFGNRFIKAPLYNSLIRFFQKQ